MKFLLWLTLLFACFGPVYAGQKVCFPAVCVDVQVAQDKEAIAKGLQFQKSLGENEGMLYVFPTSQPASFWAKNMMFPLDVIWIDKNKAVVLISPDIPPCTKEPCMMYRPHPYCPYMLEVNAGYARANGIQAGDQVKF